MSIREDRTKMTKRSSMVPAARRHSAVQPNSVFVRMPPTRSSRMMRFLVGRGGSSSAQGRANAVSVARASACGNSVNSGAERFTAFHVLVAAVTLAISCWRDTPESVPSSSTNCKRLIEGGHRTPGFWRKNGTPENAVDETRRVAAARIQMALRVDNAGD